MIARPARTRLLCPQYAEPDALSCPVLPCPRLQEVVQGLQRKPAVWNEVWSDPPTTEPNGALPGTMIQNWHVSTSGQTTAAGFPTLVSTYNEFYLDQQVWQNRRHIHVILHVFSE